MKYKHVLPTTKCHHKCVCADHHIVVATNLSEDFLAQCLSNIRSELFAMS